MQHTAAGHITGRWSTLVYQVGVRKVVKVVISAPLGNPVCCMARHSHTVDGSSSYATTLLPALEHIHHTTRKRQMTQVNNTHDGDQPKHPGPLHTQLTA